MSIEKPTQSQAPEKAERPAEDAEKKAVWEKVSAMSPAEFDSFSTAARLTEAEREAFSFGRDMAEYQKRTTMAWDERERRMLEEHPNLSALIKVLNRISFSPFTGSARVTDMTESEKSEMDDLFERVGSWTQEDLDRAFSKAQGHL
ncbi:MAG: hypothetical protein KGH56_02900 [Patescibacteria group bacterium]|nr:hypothetical protein [Patescibacteria group bacterium]